MIDLSIVIVNWNAGQYLAQCLESIRSSSAHLRIETVVVDNASTDNALEGIERQFPEAVFIHNPSNVGFARANNVGFEKCNGRSILLLNPDSVICDNALSRMLDVLDSHQEYGAVGCKILNGSGEIDFNGGRSTPTIAREITSRLRLSKLARGWPPASSTLMEHWDHSTSRQVEVLSGACMMARRKVLELVGGMDPHFFLYGEDVDYCVRMRKAGFKIYYCADATIVHYGAKSTTPVEGAMKLEGVKSLRYFYRKHGGAIAGIGYDLVLASAAALQIPFLKLRSVLGHHSGQSPVRKEENFHKQVIDLLLRSEGMA